MFYKALIGLGILSACVLVVENLVIPLQAYVFIWILQSWQLAIAGIITGFMLGFGVKGMQGMGTEEDNEDDF